MQWEKSAWDNLRSSSSIAFLQGPGDPLEEVVACLALLDSLLDLFNFHLAKTFDLEKGLAGCSMDRLYAKACQYTLGS